MVCFPVIELLIGSSLQLRLNLTEILAQLPNKGLLVSQKIPLIPSPFHHHLIIAVTHWVGVVWTCLLIDFEETDASEAGKEDLFSLVSNTLGTVKGHLYIQTKPFGYRQCQLLSRT